MKHLFRAGLLVVAVLLVVFFLPRVVSIPTSLVNFGFHKSSPVSNEKEWAGLPVSYAQSLVCETCHQEKYVAWSQSNHRTVACENCHGPARGHSEGGPSPQKDTSRDLCGTCHAKLAARPVDFPQVDMKEMGGSAPCVTCHNPHDPRAGMPPKVPHEIDDRSSCQTCHNPHEPILDLPPKIPHSLEGRTNCLACHGPDSAARPIAPPTIPHSLEGRSDCLLCHKPGGIKPFPGNHAGRTSDSCQSCHRSK